MTADATPAPTPASPAPAAPASAATAARAEPRLPSGWLTIAAKELSDHVLSSRFYVLLVVLGIAALIPLYFAAERIRSLAEAASGIRARCRACSPSRSIATT